MWRGLLGAALCCVFTVVAIPSHALEDTGQVDYSRLPGFVDITGLGVFTEEEATVEVFLDKKLLRMVSTMVSGAEPELSEVIMGLDLVRVQRYRMTDEQVDKVHDKTDEMSNKLEGDDWMRVMRIRERDETVYVYFKLGENTVQGITVMAIEEWEGYATFVNIVGEIDPEQVGRLGRKFNIDALDMDWHDLEELENMNDRSRDRDRDRDRDKDRGRDG